MEYFDQLVNINRIITGEKNNIRIEKTDKICQILDNFYSNDFNLEEFIKLCIILFNMQIFYDGNSRTIVTYLISVLDRFGYNIDINNATADLIKLKGLFPVMYDLNEQLSDNEILKIKKYIKVKKLIKEEIK